MRAVVQRVKSASVSVDGNMVSSIEGGLLVLLGIAVSDDRSDAEYICDKLVGLRIFDDENGVPNRSVVDAGGAMILVSQFTLYGDARKGRRPSYINAAKGDAAEGLYEYCKARLSKTLPTGAGIFGADMQVALVNDGPFTILLDSKKEF